MSEPRPQWWLVMRDLLSMAESTHVEDCCDCVEIFQAAHRLLETARKADDDNLSAAADASD